MLSDEIITAYSITSEIYQSNELIKNYEDQTYYYYTFLIKKIVNISKFKAVRLEENEKKWYTIKKGMWINE